MRSGIVHEAVDPGLVPLSIGGVILKADVAQVSAGIEGRQILMVRRHSDYHQAFGRLPNQLSVKASRCFERQTEIGIDQDRTASCATAAPVMVTDSEIAANTFIETSIF